MLSMHASPEHVYQALRAGASGYVLKLIVESHTSNEVGALLGLSPKSVHTYRSRMMAKLDIGELASLVKFAIRHGATSVE